MNAERTTARATQPPKRSFFLVRLNEVVKDSFWIVPSLFLVAAVVLGYSLRALDDRLAITAADTPFWVGTPGDVTRLVGAIRGAIPIEKVAFHFHDTYGQALANVLAAMGEGVTTFDASVGGIGGSPFAKMAGGNLATEDLVWMCKGMGIATGVDLEKLVATSHWLGAQLGRELPAHVSRAMRSGEH